MLLFADVFRNYEVMFSCPGREWLFLNFRWENVGLPPGAVRIIQKWLKKKIAPLTKNGLEFCAMMMMMSIQRQIYWILSSIIAFLLWKNWEQLGRIKLGTFLIQINTAAAFCGEVNKEPINKNELQSPAWGNDEKRKINRENEEISQMFTEKQMLINIQNNRVKPYF